VLCCRPASSDVSDDIDVLPAAVIENKGRERIDSHVGIYLAGRRNPYVEFALPLDSQVRCAGSACQPRRRITPVLPPLAAVGGQPPPADHAATPPAQSPHGGSGQLYHRYATYRLYDAWK